MINNVRRHIVVSKFSKMPIELEMLVKCRLCPTCKGHRQRLWQSRAVAETRLAARTWFGTLTLRPEAHYHLLSVCRAREARQGVDFDSLAENERLALIHAEASKEVTKMLKRLRIKLPAHALRHLIAVEVTKAGVLHYHLLIHEVYESHPVRHSQLADEWPLGFSKWRLVKDEAEARYVPKYLSKSLLARVRASAKYGTGGNYRSLPIGKDKGINTAAAVKNSPPKTPFIGPDLNGEHLS